ncbi:hypothetical protein Tco_1421716, partial [Tanacetum coccineum]
IVSTLLALRLLGLLVPVPNGGGRGGKRVLSLPADALHSAGLSSLLSPALRERHGLGQRWDTISEGIDAYFAKRYNDNKYNMKRDFWTAKGGAPAVDTIRHQPIGKRKFSFGRP